MWIPQIICKNHEESLIHLFWECAVVKKFWENLNTMLRNKCVNCARLVIKKELVIFGLMQFVSTDKAIDFIFIVLFAKFFIYKCRFQDDVPNCNNFLIDLKYRLKIEKNIAFKSNKLREFHQLWLPYSQITNSD